MAESHDVPDAAQAETVEPARRSEECVRLLVQHRPAIHAYITTLLPNPADADEVLQESSIVAWRKFAQFQPGSNFVGWMCGIAQLEALKFRRERQHGKLLFGEQLIEQLATEQRNSPDLWESRRQALAGCLAQLSDSDRKLLLASYESKITAKTVAQQVGRPLNTVYKALNRIRQRLFECIQRKLSQEGHA